MSGTSLSSTVPPGVPPGVYQLRVIALSATWLIGSFSDALTLIFGTPEVRPTIVAPASGSRLEPGSEVTFAWTGVPGATQYGVEFTGANRQFSNPNGTGPDPVNGYGGAGGALLAPGTSFTGVVLAGLELGAYQVRVIGLTASSQLVGMFSDAVTVIAP